MESNSDSTNNGSSLESTGFLNTRIHTFLPLEEMCGFQGNFRT